MAKIILLTRGLTATVDEADYEAVSELTWHAFDNQGKGWYARSKIPLGSGRYRRVFMHNLLLGIRGVDHIDGNGLNNQRTNLRPATAVENARNRRKSPAGSSRYKGVYLFRPSVWRAMISQDGKQQSLGFFSSEIAAALAYDHAATRMFGSFAALNFPVR
jgi:hypothetical protein